MRKIGPFPLFTALCLALGFMLPVLGTVSTYTGFTTRSSGYVVQASDWNNEFGNFIAHYNTNVIAILNTLSNTKGSILSSNGSTPGVLTNAGAGDNGKILILDSTQTNGLRWGAVASTTTLTTKGDLLGYSSALGRIPVGTNGQVLTADSTQTFGVAWSAGIPSGAIIMWSGSIASIPAGYHLCDGTASTPNLQGLFIVGAGNASPAATGGMGLLTPGGPAGDTAFAPGTGPAHTHSMGGFGANVTIGSSCFVLSPSGALTTFASAVTPRYYALCYIMKT